MRTFKPTPKQLEAQKIAIGPAKHILFEGGSRSGKTFWHLRNIATRAIKAPGSRHAILRSTFKAVKTSVVLDTFPKMMKLCYPGVQYHVNKTDWYASFVNGSEIWFGGLDDKDRVDKILGNEYVTIYLNEASLISFPSMETVKTRLAQKVYQSIDGKERLLKARMYYDCNPPSKGHWLYKIFHKKQNPDKKQLRKPENYDRILMNPYDNKDNLSEAYLEELEELSPRRRMRFLEGKYSDENPNQLFNELKIEENRVLDGSNLPDMIRIVVAVDPSGSADEENAANDEIGIGVAGLGTDGNAYVLEDCTVKAGPDTWGRIATDAYDRHMADCVVGESNFGGDMVRFVIQTAKPNVPYKAVHASRGKAVRAEPISALNDQDRIKYVGYFDKLEDELSGFSTIGYLGEGSPNRADWFVWAITELFPGVVKPPKKKKRVFHQPPASAFG